jgi:hypothetical protein
MKATQILDLEQIQDPEVLESGILAGSVMDYPAVNYAPSADEQTLFYTISPGPYDDWYIEYAYSPGLEDPEAERNRLLAIAARSSEPDLAFGNDADDMRSPGTGIDPRVNIYDLSSDSIGHALSQMALMQTTLNKMADWTPGAGKSYQETVEGAALIIRLWGISAGVISRWVGGVYVDRAVVGQMQGSEPLRPVERGEQKRAMNALATHLFAPDAFDVNGALWRTTAPERRGFEHGGGTEDPKVHEAVLSSQQRVLDHLLHPTVLKRIVDTSLYGNAYLLDEMMADLTAAIFSADSEATVNGFRRNLQMEYVQRLITIAGMSEASGYDTSARAIALFELLKLRDTLTSNDSKDAMTTAHRRLLVITIDHALERETRGRG